jgi:hypothetical protein
MASRGEDTVLLEKRLPAGAKPPIDSRPKEVEAVRMEVFDRFKATRTRPFPAAYVLPSTETRTIALLLEHGIKVERVTADWSGRLEHFDVGTVNQSARPFQGHRLVTLEGTFASANESVPAGSFIVPTAQPLGILACHILEPEGTDGAVAWGLLSDSQVGRPCAIRKAYAPIAAPAEIVLRVE